MIALLLCLSPAFPGSAVLNHPAVRLDAMPVPDSSDPVLRVYDLSNIDWSSPGESDPLAVNLLPGIDFWESPKEGVSEDEGGGDVGRVMDMIYALFEEEFQYEGRRLEETGSGRLLVLGPPALHQRIELLLAYLESVIHADADLAVDVWTLQAGQDVPEIASIVPAGEAEQWTGRLAGLGAVHSSYGLQVRAGKVGVLKLTRDVHAILDYDVEIAQGATISDPILGTAAVGTRLAVSAAPSGSGLHMALTWKRGDLLDVRSGREVYSGFLLSTPQTKPSFYDEALHITDLSVLSRSASLATHLPMGHALILETSAVLARGGVREFLVLRQVGGAMSLVRSLQLNEQGGELFFAHLGAVDPPSVVHEGVLIWPALVLENLDRRLWKSPILSAGLRRAEIGAFTDFLQELGRDALRVDVQEPWLIVLPSDVSQGSAGPSASVREGFEGMLATTEVLDVRVRLEQGGREVVAANMPVRVGTSCSFVIGIEDFEQPDYDVEVAQFSATEDPTVHTALDGLVLFLDPLVESGGGLSMRIRGGGHLLLGREVVDLGGTVPARVDQSEYASLFVNETVGLRSNGNGSWSRVFGQQASETGPQDLTLRIDVTK